MIVDLVSPWSAAVDATDSRRAREAFRARHAPLLELLRRARTPLRDTLTLATDPEALRPLARRAADPAVQQQIRDALSRAGELGADRCGSVQLVAGDGTGDAAEPIPWPDADAVLFLDRTGNDDMMIVALARVVTALTRWTAPDSQTPVAHDASRGWDRWQSARDVPLREWVYTEGVGLHLAQALRPDLPTYQLLGITQVALGRLRQREKVFRALLDADLDQRGVGPLLRWLTPGAPSGPRTIGDMVLPPTAGHYLAWRMLAERVERVGLREAIRMEA
jgi:hypothetical protein